MCARLNSAARPPATRRRPPALSCAFVPQIAATEDNRLLGTWTLLVKKSC